MTSYGEKFTLPRLYSLKRIRLHLNDEMDDCHIDPSGMVLISCHARELLEDAVDWGW